MNSATKIVTKVAKITKSTKFWEAIDKAFDRKMQIRGRNCCIYIYQGKKNEGKVVEGFEEKSPASLFILKYEI